MNVLAPIKTIMTTDLITVNPGDKLTAVKEIFDENNIHHIPVVRFREMVGIISKSDFMYFLRGFSRNEEDRFVNYARLRAYTAEDIMTTGLAKLSPEDRINVALEIFMVNRFHAIPVIDKKELVGIVTSFDIIKKLNSEEVTSDQILSNKK
ncbi:MAG TPA: CBS domain-containing protein [Saprospiraceae bacterium]|nr:CBS domain-containing protein [Saprospiraceae bacterium]